MPAAVPLAATPGAPTPDRRPPDPPAGSPRERLWQVRAGHVVLAECDVALWRRGTECFRLGVARSFAGYLAGYLRVAERGSG